MIRTSPLRPGSSWRSRCLPIWQRLRQLAAEMGYQVNPLVSALMANLKKSRISKFKPMLGLIHCHPDPESRRNSPHYQALTHGISEQADSLGYRLTEFWLEAGGMSDRRLNQILDARGISGLILGPSFSSGREIDFEWEKFSVVAIGYSTYLPDVHRACSHQLHAITVTMSELQRLGYQRIGLAMCRHIDNRVDHNYKAGFLLMQDMIPQRSRIPILWMDRILDESLFNEWFEKHQPDVIVTTHLQIQEWLAGRNLSIPGDIGFAHLDTPDTEGGISGINQRWYMLGTTAIDIIVGMLQRNERGKSPCSRTVMIEGEWIPGSTVRRVAPAGNFRKKLPAAAAHR